MTLPMIRSSEELAKLVEEIGFLPLFGNDIPGFSLKDCTPKELWFVEGVKGPWEWREDLAVGGKIAYGKLFRGNAGFVSLEWYPDLVNYRRNGYDFDSLYEDGLAPRKNKFVMDVMYEYEGLLSTDIKKMAGFGKEGMKGFDSVLTQLQMQTYLTVKAFEYKKDKQGKTYGWGVGRYIMPEKYYGEDLVRSAYERDPEESLERLLEQAAKIAPEAGRKELMKLLKA